MQNMSWHGLGRFLNKGSATAARLWKCQGLSLPIFIPLALCLVLLCAYLHIRQRLCVRAVGILPQEERRGPEVCPLYVCAGRDEAATGGAIKQIPPTKPIERARGREAKIRYNKCIFMITYNR